MKKISAAFLALFMMLGFTLAGCGNSDDENNTSGDTGNDDGGSKSIGEQVDYTIIGIDPGAGEMKLTKEQVMPKYGLDDKWNLQSGSGATMTAALQKAINDKEPIIVTGWSPHWMFAKFDLKYLKDPKNIYGKAEEIHTIATKGFNDKLPNAATFFKQFKWTPDDMNAVMLNGQESGDIEAAAADWVKANQDKVSEWTKGVEKVDGKEITMAYVAWASAVASNNVVKVVLTDLGYDVKMQQLGAAPMWTAVAQGSADVTLAAWLPTTHEAYMEKYKDQVVDLGVSLTGTKLGLVVPSYVDIDSIEDLK